ncbi:MAG: hypothetical protein KDE53_35600, partial [Caldilineaceae bacterium]|nr:hypothetical protein [Caldilineaceae bacterium]
NPYAYVANNPTTWVDPSGYSIFDHQLTPNEAAIVVALMVSVTQWICSIVACCTATLCRRP